MSGSRIRLANEEGARATWLEAEEVSVGADAASAEVPNANSYCPAAIVQPRPFSSMKNGNADIRSKNVLFVIASFRDIRSFNTRH